MVVLRALFLLLLTVLPLRAAEVTAVCCTESGIETAATQAGESGTVIIPAGTWVVDDLRVTVAGQTWVGEGVGRTILKRSDSTATPVGIIVEANGFRLRELTLDGNRYVNSENANGISAGGFSLDIAKVDIHSFKQYGISQFNAPLIIFDSSVRKTGSAGIFWRIISSGTTMQGPHIERVTVSRSIPSDYVNSGGILIQSQDNGRRVLSPRVINSNVNLPQGSDYDAVSIEISRSDRPKITGNDISGGRIGISFGDGDYGVVTENTIKFASSYAIEMAGNSTDNVISSNTVLGTGGRSTGVENSGTSHRNKIIANAISGCRKRVRIAPGISGFLVWGN